MLGMDSDGLGIGKLVVLAMAGEAEGVVVVGLGQLRSAGSSMRIVAIEAENPSVEMNAPLKVEPLLVMGF